MKLTLEQVSSIGRKFGDETENLAGLIEAELGIEEGGIGGAQYTKLREGLEAAVAELIGGTDWRPQ